MTAEEIHRGRCRTTCPYCHSDGGEDLGPACELAELADAATPSIIRVIAETLRDSRLVRCGRCSLQFRDPQLAREDLERLYQNLPATIWQYDAASVGSWVTAKKQLLPRYSIHDPVSVLDVGAFDGAFLNQLPDAWKKFAIEPSPKGREMLRSSQIELIAEYVEDLSLITHGDRFDIVTLFDVFEHLPDPSSTLKTLAGLVKPSGRLVISTCNADHWSWRLLRGQHWYLHSIQHLCFATTEFFRAWGEQHGLLVESLVNHPHQIAGDAQRVKHSLEVLHSWAMDNGRTYLARVIQTIPGFRHLAHKRGVVFANTLSDHQLAMFQRPASSAP
ncbi:Ubiquinone biosynthesis O-methyltransferase [Stieleria magnilauensis]|uniref:Ubiquinone biosynthesis O-methyltransferase n=1 Tax=Stieleria magnilauensis TaxID=2527963 RepID=A0ABX5XPV2_9BACT|nr:Ubiquinone biosynthesis O-methyltransferase [Planctomycetes bacterium TBK1r]